MISVDILYQRTAPFAVVVTACLGNGYQVTGSGEAEVVSKSGPPSLKIHFSAPLYTSEGKGQYSVRDIDPKVEVHIKCGLSSRAVIFSGQVAQVCDDNKVLVKVSEVVQTYQQREYFRVRANLQVHYRVNDSLCSGAQEKVSCLDISGGGVLLTTSRYLEPGTSIELDFLLPLQSKQVRITCPAVVVRCHRSGIQECKVGVEFDELSEEDRDIIIAFCLKRQRQERRENVEVADNQI